MNLLIINLDKGIFSKNSSSLNRLKEYSQLVDKLFVIVWTKERYKIINFADKLFVYPTNSKNKLQYYFDTFKIFKKIKADHKIDLLFTQDPFETGLAGWFLKKIYKLPLQLHVHTDFFSRFFRQESLLNRIRFWLANLLIPKADAIRVVSQRLKEQLVDDFGVVQEKITVVPIYTEVKSYKVHKVKGQNDKFIFLTVGRLVGVKNIEMQIRAIKEVVEEYKNVELWIVGEGKEDKKLEVETHGNASVRFLGWQNNLEKFYGQADAFLLTSNYEGWGMAVIEAASFGLPIIMTDVGCAGEVIKGFEHATIPLSGSVHSNENKEASGIVIPVGGQKELEAAMRKIVEDKDLRENLGSNAKKAIEKLPSKEETLKLYKESWEKAVSINN